MIFDRTFSAINRVDSHEVGKFPAFTEDLERLVNWLIAEGITTVAMESTGIYWLNLYLMLEESGIEPYLVNAQHVKNVTGRREMIQMQYGFRSFMPVD